MADVRLRTRSSRGSPKAPFGIACSKKRIVIIPIRIGIASSARLTATAATLGSVALVALFLDYQYDQRDAGQYDKYHNHNHHDEQRAQRIRAARIDNFGRRRANPAGDHHFRRGRFNIGAGGIGAGCGKCERAGVL